MERYLFIQHSNLVIGREEQGRQRFLAQGKPNNQAQKDQQQGDNYQDGPNGAAAAAAKGGPGKKQDCIDFLFACFVHHVPSFVSSNERSNSAGCSAVMLVKCL